MNALTLFKNIIFPHLWMQMNVIAAGIGVGGAVGGAAIAGSAAKSAAGAAAAASEAATAEQRRQFDITQEQMEPWRQAGLRGLTSYEDMIGGYAGAEGLIQSQVPGAFQFGAEEFEQYQDPGYQFRLAEGERALSRGSARGGALGSGARYRGLMDLGQQMASQEFGAARGRAYQDYATGVASEQEQYQRSLGAYGRQYTDPMSRYGQLAGVGQATTTGLGQLRAGMANQIGQNMQQAGAYQAAGQMGQARAWQQGLAGIGQGLGQLGQPAGGAGIQNYAYRPPSNAGIYGPMQPPSWG